MPKWIIVNFELDGESEAPIIFDNIYQPYTPIIFTFVLLLCPWRSASNFIYFKDLLHRVVPSEVVIIMQGKLYFKFCVFLCHEFCFD